jgi:uncharacterized coiled-coil protein SlyX
VVFVNSDGKLGTTNSSRRFKDDIKPMDKASNVILALNPVTFHYKKEFDPKGIPQFGLVAEDVEKIDPDLVIRDKDGKLSTVRYDAINAMLLNEFLKEHKAFLEEQCKVHDQEATIANLKSRVAKQEEGMEALAAHIRDQDSRIQAVSDQLQPSTFATARIRRGGPAPQMAVNNP